MPNCAESCSSSAGSSPVVLVDPSSTKRYSADGSSEAHAQSASMHRAVMFSLFTYAMMKLTAGRSPISTPS